MQTVEVIASVTRTGGNQALGPLYSCCTTSLLIRTHGSPWSRYSIFTWPGCEVKNENAMYSILFSSLCLHPKQYLPKHLHLLCVDMPGHEGTTRTSTDDYSVQGQVKRIRQFVEAIRLNRKPFHLVGTSMGGTVAGVYAACHPSDLYSLTLICPVGLKIQSESKFDSRMHDVEHSQYTLNIPLIPSTPEEMEEMLKLCSHVRFRVPQQILQGLVDVRIPHNDFYHEVFMEIMSENSKYALHEHMQQITTPLQVIWGKQDQVVDVSGAAVLAEALPHCRVDLLENCGHSVVMERPRQTAKLILDFIISQQSTESASTKKKS
ncbi:unnamed protein product [Leuciscus chuanchicus]